jgi:hypothetical protein
MSYIYTVCDRGHKSAWLGQLIPGVCDCGSPMREYQPPPDDVAPSKPESIFASSIWTVIAVLSISAAVSLYYLVHYGGH